MAININELRIGNMVNFSHIYNKEHLQRPCRIKSLGEKECLLDDSGYDVSIHYTSDGIAPTPLSGEVLQAVGFKIDEDGMYTIPFHECGLYWLETKMQLTLGGMPMINFDCKSLHQLQNLYFALSGTELIYNPSK